MCGKQLSGYSRSQIMHSISALLWMIPSAFIWKAAAYIMFRERKKRRGQMEDWSVEANTHICTLTWKQSTLRWSGDFWETHLLYPSVLTKNKEGAVLVDEVMRKLGDTQLVLRVEAFLRLWQKCELLMGVCDFVTNLSESIRHWLTLINVKTCASYEFRGSRRSG